MNTPPPPAPAEPSPRAHRAGRLALGLVLLAIGVAWLLDALGVEVPWEVLLPGALIAIGVMLVLGARAGSGQPGLIAAGVVLTVLLFLGTAIDVPLGGGVGDRTVHPTGSVIDREVELGIGKLTVDLTDADLAALGRGEIRARVGIGQLVVIVPIDAPPAVEARAGLGSVRVDEREEGGVDVEITTPPAADMTSVTLIATVGIGEVSVQRG